MAERKPIKEYLTNNTIRTYYALDTSMMTAHRNDKNEDAEKTARILLDNDDLPLLLRARACMVLGCSIQSDFLDMAKEGVRIAELALSLCEDSPGELEKNLLEDCKTVLKEAQEAHDDAHEGAEDIDDAGELVWEAEHSAAPDGEEDEQMREEGEQPTEATGEGVKKKKAGVSRLITDPEKMTLVGPSPPRLPRKSEKHEAADAEKQTETDQKDEDDDERMED